VLKARRSVFLAGFAAVLLKATDASAHIPESFFYQLYETMAFHILLPIVILFTRRVPLRRRLVFSMLYWLSIFGLWILITQTLLLMNEVVFFIAIFIAPVLLILIFWCLATRSLPQWLALAMNGLRMHPKDIFRDR